MEHDPRSLFRPAPTAKVVASVLVCVGVGCSLLVDADRPQCTTDAECVARGFGDAICIEALCQSAPLSLPEEPGVPREGPSEQPRDIVNIARDAGDDEPAAPDPIEAGVPVLDAGGDPEWACLENFEPPSVAAGSLVSYRLRFERGGQANVPPEGLTLRLCRNDDATCATPIVDIPEPDATGLLTLELDPTFRGYLEVEAPDYMPSLASLPPLVISPSEPQIIRLIERFDFLALIATTDLPYDSDRGFAIVLTNSCLDQRAAGVVLSSLDIDELTAPYHYRNGEPDREALQTDAQGAAGWSQLPVGTIVAEARRADTLEFIGVAEFQSRAGFVTYVPIGPTPPP
jgi:hypothetical protein